MASDKKTPSDAPASAPASATPSAPQVSATSAVAKGSARSPKASPSRSAQPRPPKPQYVRVRNRLNQPLTISVVNDAGTLATESIKLGPREASRPLRKDRLSSYTLGLEAKGHVRIS